MKTLSLVAAGAMISNTNATASEEAEALKASEYSLQAILDIVSTAFYLLDQKATITFFNKSASGMTQRLQGKALEVGTSFRDLVPDQFQDAFNTAFRRSLGGDTVQHERNVLGTWFEVTYQPITESGVVTGVCLTCGDITARKQAEENLYNSQEQLARIFHHSPAATFIVASESHRIVDVNESFLKLTAYDRADVIGKTLEELKVLNGTDIFQNGKRDVVPTTEQRLQAADGTWRTVVMASEKVEYMQQSCLLLTCIDITERKQTEEQILQAAQEVMRDTTWFGRSLLEKLAEVRSTTPPRAQVDLTNRERQVLRLMATGKANSDIARELSISHQTVRNYVTRIYDKLGVHSRAEAVVWARQHGLISV